MIVFYILIAISMILAAILTAYALLVIVSQKYGLAIPDIFAFEKNAGRFKQDNTQKRERARESCRQEEYDIDWYAEFDDLCCGEFQGHKEDNKKERS